MRSIDRNFYSSASWMKCRKEYMNKVNGLCELCLEKGLIVPADIVHHKVHLNEETFKDKSLVYGFDNLQAVCIKCHNEIHFGTRKISRRYEVVDGELVFTDNSTL